jgi:membrane protein
MVMINPKEAWQILREAFTEFNRENVARLGAGLAYYTLFAIAPLLIVAIGVAGMVFGAEAARGEVVRQIDGLVGHDGAQAIQEMLASVSRPGRSIPATIVGLITLFLGATSAFASLQGALNEVWNVKEKPRGPVLGFLRGRLLSFGLVLGVGFLLLVSLALSAALAALGNLMSSSLPGGATLWAIVNFLISFGFTTILFAMIYKVLPDVPLTWRDVWMGGLITSLFFTIGKTLIGLYLGHSAIGSSFGAAGSIIVLLVWVYYSSQILLFGAEVTQAVVRRREGGKPQRPTRRR